MSSSPKTVKILGGLVAVLALVCLALIIVIVNKNESPHHHHDEPGGEPEPEGSSQTPLPVYTHPWEKNVRLPRDVLPLHYDLLLHPDLDTGLFTGHVDVHVKSTAQRDHFLLHTKYLTISETKFFQSDSSGNKVQELPLKNSFEYERNEFLVFRARDEVEPGFYVLSIEFNGNLTRGIVGFYRSIYTNEAGEKRPIATSKFQPTYARRAFPCFDEPSFKSTFTVNMVRPSDGYIALSNMPVAREKASSPSHGLTTVTFEKSVPMVTYLACFIVCDFEFQEKLTQIHQTKFRVYATPAQKETVKYALDIGANVTDFFEDYFQVAYPLPKQDMIAIPDFVSGAMEHWGLITYRETNLLYNPKESSSYNQQRVGTVVSHELAHQWFGNLVTLSWWDDLWLNEGFASYIEYKGVDNYHKDWEMEAQFLSLDLHHVMNLDATRNSHPIIQKVEHPDQITEIFDAISYSKGASVLRMLESFMGAEEFRGGISNFLKKFAYKNAVTPDLWKELASISSKGLNISRIMDTWTKQMGYPVIQAKKVDTNVYRLTQKRYLQDPNSEAPAADESPFDYRWDVPITWITDRDPKNPKLEWFSYTDPHKDIVLPSGTKWVKFNVGQYGYYRVNYEKDDWSKLSAILLQNHEQLSDMDRSALLNDAFSLAESGHLDYSVPLGVTQYLKKEKKYVPWNTAYSQLHNIKNLLSNTEMYPKFRQFILSLVEDHAQSFGWEDVGSHTEKRNRINVLTLACEAGHESSLQEAGKLFEDWIETKRYIPPNLRTLVYKYGMQSRGDASSWNIMLQRYMSETNAQEKQKLLLGLAYSDKPWILNHFIKLAQNETIVRSQDYFKCLRYIARNPIGTPLVWNYLRASWPELVERFSLNDRYFGRMPKYITAGFATQFQLDEIKAFFKKYPEAGAGARARKQALENVENNIRWLKHHKKTIKEWLNKLSI